MAYDEKRAARIREYLYAHTTLPIEEKKMFRGLTFMVNGKMCINVSGANVMCRFNPEHYPTVSLKKGFQKMVMRGRIYKGY